jgi:pimeloyl-ACP methyl ester carboxylesterase
MPVAIDRIEVPVPGGALATFRFGAAPPGPPAVVVVHGITANSHSWLAVARALDSRVALLAPDLRGRARSNALPGPFGMAAHARDIVAVLDHFELERAVLVGHSLGAYIIARVAVGHPERIASVLLVDGGLTVPVEKEDVDPQAFVEGFLGPALARLRLTFATRSEYVSWWRRHPAFAGGDVADADLVSYADHDLVGEPPALRSSVSEAAVRGDAADLFEMGEPAHRLAVPATLMCAPRGLLDEPNPMQPLALVQEWAAKAPERRRAMPVPDVNHYTITLGRRGARVVASEVVAAVASAGAQHQV